MESYADDRGGVHEIVAWLDAGNDDYEIAVEIQYCPFCGRKLGEDDMIPAAYDVEEVVKRLKSATVEIGGVPLVSTYTAETIVRGGGADDAERD